MNPEYLLQFEEAKKFTKEMGLECPEFILEPELDFTAEDRLLLINAILYEVYTRSKLRIEDVAMKCFWISRDLQSFLKARFDLNSVVTSGYVHSNGLSFYRESKESIRERLNNPNHNSPIGFHTWLTLTNHLVLDLTMAPTLWIEQMSAGLEASVEDHKKIAWFDYRVTDRKFIYYEPVFLGYEYFNKVTVTPRLNFLFNGGDAKNE